ncbi:hypothetical protein [Streptosporangium sp. CA-115845]|uniref:hypothetical protein n=1 Tax=Streptosporangium sp. CA-115845 TaxID=3240071 RepID=UPI003D91BE48
MKVTDGMLAATWERLTRLWDTPDTTPRIEPVDPPADVLAAMSAPPVDPDPPTACDLTGGEIEPTPLVGYRGQIEDAECAVLDDLAARIAGGMSPLAAARDRFARP